MVTKSGSSTTLWIGVVLFTSFLIVLWSLTSWLIKNPDFSILGGSSSQVTNRDFSIFLWQQAYDLKDYQGRLEVFRALVLDEKAFDQPVRATPENLWFYYHWKGLLGEKVSKRGVALQEFRDFLKAVPEWNPKNWPGAPESYHLFVTDVEKSTAEESKPLSLENIPLKVAQVFVAWKNMFREYEAIMDLKPSWSQMDSFLSKAPFYERSKWRNFYSHYIVSSLKKVEKKEHIPKEEIPFFLRAALFNDLKETKAKEASA